MKTKVKTVKTPFGYSVKVGGLKNTGACKYKNKKKNERSN